MPAVWAAPSIASIAATRATLRGRIDVRVDTQAMINPREETSTFQEVRIRGPMGPAARQLRPGIPAAEVPLIR